MKLLMLSIALAAASMAQEPFQLGVTGHGRPMILIPGMPSSGETWDTTACAASGPSKCRDASPPGCAKY